MLILQHSGITHSRSRVQFIYISDSTLLYKWQLPNGILLLFTYIKLMFAHIIKVS
jgi:hypothetical protein